MSPYFKPLRRKVGLVTLVVACVFTALWVRCLTVEDVMTMKFNQRQLHRCISSMHYHGILWQATRYPDQGKYQAALTSWILITDPKECYWDRSDVWEGRIACFKSEAYPNGIRQSLFLIKYWIIVVALTSLSTWLLLSRSRANRPCITPTPPRSWDSTRIGD